jgi:L-seryl-tRNA(Ser) seleniumtransferase
MLESGELADFGGRLPPEWVLGDNGNERLFVFMSCARNPSMAGNSTRARVTVPTVSELLESPAVQALAERWNKSAVAAGLRTFVEDLRGDLQRRVDSGSWPTSHEWAERAAQWLLSRPPSSLHPVINATGRLWGSEWVGIPQRDAALAQAFAVGREFVVDARENASPSPRAGDAEALICQWTGAEAAVVVHSYASAVWLAMAMLGQGREVLVARGDMVELEPGCRLDALAAAAGVRIREIGSVNRCTIGDFEAALTDATAAVLEIGQDDFQIVGTKSIATREERVALARDRELVAIEAVGFAALAERKQTATGESGFGLTSVRQCVCDGVSLVVARGDGLVGGPPCGILAGEAKLVARIVQQPMFRALRVEPARRAGLAVELRQNDVAAAGLIGGGIGELLSAPLENLKLRAERLAALLSQANGIVAAEVTQIDDGRAGGASDWEGRASYGVALSPAEGRAEDLAKRLAAGPLPIFANVEDGRVVLNLRSVFPRQDAAIAAALSGTSETAMLAAAETAGES